jgi:uncharacterized coiled-coil protein SlyX
VNDSEADRLRRIEAALAHVERLCDDLNSEVVRQGRELARLRAQLLKITRCVENAELERIRATNPKPPHHL